jgi:hypothetical protein
VCFIHWERVDSKKGKNVRERGCSPQAIVHKQIKEHVYSPNANVRDAAVLWPRLYNGRRQRISTARVYLSLGWSSLLCISYLCPFD